jgi:protein O-mannosyl-transferase
MCWRSRQNRQLAHCPTALFLILWLQKKRIDWTRVWQIVPFVALGLTMGLIAVWWERYHMGTRGPMFVLGPLERLIVATHGAWFYLGKLFWPAKLTFVYPQWTIAPNNPFSYIWLVAGIALCAAIYFGRRHVGRSVEVATAFFIATLSPVLGFIMLYTFRYTFVADHYQYLACIGPIALVSAGLVKLTESAQLNPRFLSSLGILMLAVLGVLTWRQSEGYRDIETLWRTTIDRNPGCWMAEHNLGTKLLDRGEIEEAIVHFERASQLKSDNPETHFGLAAALWGKGDIEVAITEARISLNLRPDDVDTHFVLGTALMTKGLVDEAITHFSKVIEIRPNHSGAHYDLAIALWEKHQTAEAIEHYEKAIEAEPDFLEALTNLAWIFANYPDATIRNGPKAVELAERANHLTGGTTPLVLRTLAAAYASIQDRSKALETSRRALELAQEQHNPEAAEAIRREMSFYETGRQPY